MKGSSALRLVGALAIAMAGCPQPTAKSCAELGWTCGVDDNGLSCGGCGGTRTCSEGACHDSPVTACVGRVCGTDEGGNSCGSCASGQTCIDGACSAPSPTCTCNGHNCGADACGNPCGTCSTGQTCSAGTCVPSASEHTLASGSSPLFSGYYGVPFTVPVQTLVGYTASSPSDTFDFGIFPQTDWAIYSSGGTGARAYGGQQHVAQVNDAVTLPPGAYYLRFRCTNLIERCAITYAAVASY